MEGVSTSFYKGLRRYWRRRGYNRLSGTDRRRKNRVELGSAGSNRRRKRFWRIKIAPKLRFSPKKLFIGLRDAYVNMMLRISNSSAINVGGGEGLAGFGRGPLKEYDEKMIIEIYKSLVIAQGQFVPRDAPKIVGRC